MTLVDLVVLLSVCATLALAFVGARVRSGLVTTAVVSAAAIVSGNALSVSILLVFAASATGVVLSGSPGTLTRPHQ